MRFIKKPAISDGLRETEGTIGEMVKRLARLPLYGQPGEGFEYGMATKGPGAGSRSCRNR